MPDLVRDGSDLPGRSVVSTLELTDEQRAATLADGELFLSAGAGTGKTSVVIARIARAISDGAAPERVLVVTYTEAAARELVDRLARALPSPSTGVQSPGSRVHASTIHGLCARLLREHALAAGLPADLQVLDEGQARVLARTAFALAVERGRAADPEPTLALLTDYGFAELRALVLELDRKLRARGESAPPLPPEARPLAEPLDALRAACGAMLAGAVPSEQARKRLERLRALLARDPVPAELANLKRFSSRPLGALKEPCEAVQRVALEHLDRSAHERLLQLLPRFRAAYQRAKEREGALDFDDLQERLCDLLEADSTVRAAVQAAYDLVLVDEFQDTNGLQCRLLDLVSAESRDRVFVGDEFQSIYRFRDADVGLFRARRDGASTASALTGNFRSRAPVLAFVNELFGGLFDEGSYRPLVPAATFPSPAAAPAVELVVVDGRDQLMPARREAEAAAVATRLRAIVSEGVHGPGDCVVLLRSGSDAAVYERALDRAGLPSASLIAQRYYGMQAVRDVTAYLALVRNRFDDMALASVLASPLVGLSNDGLLALRRAAQAALYYPIQYDQLEGLAEADRTRVRCFRERYEAIVAASSRCRLTELVQRVIDDHDYDLASLVRRDGRQRDANLRKLVQLADEFERLRGADLAGLLDALDTLEAEAVREAEAVTEAQAGAVRIMTIHAAKGLEFPVVAVADLARIPVRTTPSVAVAADGRVGLTLRDAHGGSVRSPLLDAIIDEARREDEAERRRVLYVALTRAQHRLLLAGSVPAAGDSDLAPVLAAAGVDEARLRVGEELACEIDGHPIAVHVFDGTSSVTAGPIERPGRAAPAVGEQLSLLDQPIEHLPPLSSAPGRARHRPRALSFSALELHERCGFRYYAERVLGLRAAPAGAGPRGTIVGDAVHRAVAGDRSQLAALAEGERERAATLLAAWEASSLAGRIGELADVQRELEFAFLEREVVLRGSFDLYAVDPDGSVLIVDLKTNRLGESAPAAIAAERYRLQQVIYALAALRGGAPAVELAFCFLERPESVVSQRFSQADSAALADELGAAIDRLLGSEFPARPGLVCRDCPALDRICAGTAA